MLDNAPTWETLTTVRPVEADLGETSVAKEVVVIFDANSDVADSAAHEPTEVAPDMLDNAPTWETLTTVRPVEADLGETSVAKEVVVIFDANSDVAEPEVQEPEVNEPKFVFNPLEGLSRDKFPKGTDLTADARLYAGAFVETLTSGQVIKYEKGREGTRVVKEVIKDSKGNPTSLRIGYSDTGNVPKSGKWGDVVMTLKELEDRIADGDTDYRIEPQSPEMGVPSEATKVDPIDASSEVLAALELPRSFSEMRPEGYATKVMKAEFGGVEVDLRQSSMLEHEDGVAYNPNTGTIVVCDGLGGVGKEGDVRSYFAFALAHATAELTDISMLSNPDVVASVVERAKIILATQLGIIVEKQAGRITTSRKEAFASTIAAIQNIEGTKKWRVATIGDSSVVLLGADGKIRRGFGEAFQQLAAGDVGSDGTANDAPMSSVVGISKDTLAGIVRYEQSISGRRFGAEFTEVELQPGERLVVASDAYIQKTAPHILERDASEAADAWKARAPRYSDDTTLAIVG
jgi:serine/threonine protein phosphatase PrpC